MVDNLTHPYNRRQVVTIDVLPDDVLLAIFDFHVFKYQDLLLLEVVYGDRDTKMRIESWQSLVHVCRRWRGLVFSSPRRLNLQLQVFYRLESPESKPPRKSLDVWPALPLLIQGYVYETSVDDVIAELEHSDRICQIILDFNMTPQIEIEKLWTAMQVPFLELEILCLSIQGLSYVPDLPGLFLGGSAPRLRYLEWNHVPTRGLPNLLKSTTHLVHLYLYEIPHSGYLSPNTVVTCLSTLTSLESLRLYFESPQSSPDQESRSPPSSARRSILPALKSFSFKGVNEYLEELLSGIDTPRLQILSAAFFNDIDFETPELIRFLSRSSTFKAPNEAHLFFDGQTASVKLLPQASNAEYFLVKILCRVPNWQLSSLAQICTAALHLFSTTENLLIYEPADLKLHWKDGIENIEWLESLLPFTAAKNLYISNQLAPHIAPTRQGGAIEVLSTLQNLYLEGFEPSKPVQEGIERFISGRKLTDHPVVISVWDKELTWDRLEGHYY